MQVKLFQKLSFGVIKNLVVALQFLLSKNKVFLRPTLRITRLPEIYNYAYKKFCYSKQQQIRIQRVFRESNQNLTKGDFVLIKDQLVQKWLLFERCRVRLFKFTFLTS